MPNIAKVGDQAVGTCFAHKNPIPVSGQIINGVPTILVNNQPIATVGSTVIFSCGHSGTIASGFPMTLAGNRPVATVGSQVTGPMIAQIVSGSPNVIT